MDYCFTKRLKRRHPEPLQSWRKLRHSSVEFPLVQKTQTHSGLQTRRSDPSCLATTLCSHLWSHAQCNRTARIGPKAEALPDGAERDSPSPDIRWVSRFVEWVLQGLLRCQCWGVVVKVTSSADSKLGSVPSYAENTQMVEGQHPTLTNTDWPITNRYLCRWARYLGVLGY